MANFGNLLGSFLQNTMPQSGQGRLGNLVNDLQSDAGSAQPSAGGLGGLLGNVLGMAKGTASSAANNPLQAAGIGAVLGSLLGGGGNAMSGAVKGGALAVLAGVAYKALTSSGQAQPAADPVGAPVGLQGSQTPAETEAVEDKAKLVIRGMMNIAKSDGEVSADEVLRITSRLREAGMDDEAEAWIMAELRGPLDLDAFVAEIPDAQAAAEVYAASLLAVEVDTPEERDYLAEFARRTGIDGPVARQIEQSLGVQL